ncbi:hypothetical protein BDZ88DRAFT_41877 [Geranomyces variabilis]|nr:hypothetical protein BDZ88DRAFT_41877 [Geranomyces variabilis]KAJ3137965.1 hypothetical protein HDU90_001440 [Geranomyces variabilis]
MAARTWSAPVVATLIDALRAAERERTLALLAAAYENVAIDRVAAMLGMVDLDEVAAKVLEQGWKVEDGGRWLVPPPNAEQLGMAGARNGVAPEHQFGLEPVIASGPIAQIGDTHNSFLGHI